MDTLKKYYEKYNFPNKNKFRDILKKEGVSVSVKDLDSFLKKQEVNQIYNEPVKLRGHTVSFDYLDRIEMDILNMENYATKNKGYSYILLIIDIFTRKLWAYLMKKRDDANVSKVLEQFVDKYHPHIIISDNEKAFLSKKAENIYEENNIKHITAEPTDHKALGVIDRVSKTIKIIIMKHMHNKNNGKYVDYLPEIIANYNSTPHTSLLGLTPDEATQPKNFQLLFDYNLEKGKNNTTHSQQFKVGDSIRIRNRKETFERAYDKKYSDIRTIVSIEKNVAQLDDDTSVNLRRLRKVDADTEKVSSKKMDELAKETKVKKKVQKEHLEIKSKGYDVLPEAKTRAQGGKHLSSDGKALSKKDRYRYTGVDTAQILTTKRRDSRDRK